MKKLLYHILVSLFSLTISCSIAFLTELNIVIDCVKLVFMIQWFMFIPSYFFQSEKFYDLTGSLTYLSVILYTYFSFYSSNGFHLGNSIISLFIIFWALRLGTFLFRRIHKAGGDKRFKFIKSSASHFFMAWSLQGMWVSICSICALTAMSTETGIILNFMFFIGVIIFLLGLSIEMIADYQKTVFRRQPHNKDLFISSGLWAYSRHPNYVGEIILWTGIAMMSFSSLSGFKYLTLISPFFTYLLLVYISGVSILEASGRDKWGHLKTYQEYLKKTPVLFIK